MRCSCCGKLGATVYPIGSSVPTDYRVVLGDNVGAPPSEPAVQLPPAQSLSPYAGQTAGSRRGVGESLYSPIRVAYILGLNPAWFAQRPPRVPARGVYFYGTIMTPVCVYIDGFNLYHALLRFGDNKVKWLDLNALSHRLISPKSEKVQSIFYFSAFARWLPAKRARHEIYVKALEARGVTCVLGHFKNKDRKCIPCGATWSAHEEKETDVSIGISLVNDAYKQRYERAYLVTRDSDLMPAVRMIRAEFPRLLWGTQTT
jgi:hypothetical protein